MKLPLVVKGVFCLCAYLLCVRNIDGRPQIADQIGLNRVDHIYEEACHICIAQGDCPLGMCLEEIFPRCLQIRAESKQFGGDYPYDIPRSVVKYGCAREPFADGGLDKNRVDTQRSERCWFLSSVRDSSQKEHFPKFWPRGDYADV